VILGFIFLRFFLSSLIMASNSNKDNDVVNDLFCVGKKPLKAVSLFSSNGAAKIPHCLIGRREDWEVNLPNTSDRICSRFSANRIPMYEAFFPRDGF